jgi:hypothetical protein
MSYSPVKINWRFRGTQCFHLQGRRISNAKKTSIRQTWSRALLTVCLAYFYTPKMEAICSSETSVDFNWTARRYIPEDRALHTHRCVNLKCNTVFYLFFREKSCLSCCYFGSVGHAERSWLRGYATSQKVAGSSPDEVTGFFFNWTNPSSRTMALELTQYLELIK